MKSRLIGLLLIILLCAGMLPSGFAAAFAEEPKTYLALGDSISTGYGLSDADTEAFPVLLAQKMDYTSVNMAINGATTATLLKDLAHPEYQNAVKAADVITLTIGGNDMMALLYDFLAKELEISEEDIQTALAQQDVAMLMQAAMAINRGWADPSPAVMESICDDMRSVITEIKAVNAGAALVVATQYNPFAELAAELANPPSALAPYMPLLSSVIRALNTLTASVENSVGLYNSTIKEYAEAQGYLVADVHAAFSDGQVKLCNAGIDTDSVSVNLDIHPNAAGHQVIASTIEAVLSGERGFIDVNESDWFYTPVQFVYKNGLMQGVTKTAFAPGLALTRGMFVTILYRAEGGPFVQASMPFSDVNTNHYYHDAVSWANANGIVNGMTETAFAPNDTLTREQMAAILYRYAIMKGISISTTADYHLLDFTDHGEISPYATAALNWAVSKGIMHGKDNNILAPKGCATRAETAKILESFMEINWHR